MRIFDSVVWDVDRNVDADIDNYIVGGVDSGVDVLIERESEKEIKL